VPEDGWASISSDIEWGRIEPILATRVGIGREVRLGKIEFVIKLSGPMGIHPIF
jgi:hypothetical protein